MNRASRNKRTNRRKSNRRRHGFKKALKRIMHREPDFSSDHKLAGELLKTLKNEGRELHLDDVYQALRGKMKLQGLNAGTVKEAGPGFVNRVRARLP